MTLITDQDHYTINGIHSTRFECEILDILWKEKGEFVTKRKFMDLLYSDRLVPPEPDIIKTMICRLRKKLDGSPYKISSEYHLGYKLEDANHVV